MVSHFQVKNIGTIEAVMNHELKLLVQCWRSEKLSLNETKTQSFYLDLHENNYPITQAVELKTIKLKIPSIP